MNFIKIITAPLVGGIIGYITNDLAIKMLFRPRKAIYIRKWHVPFTPGLIPQQKERIAVSIGKVISKQLLNAETIKKTIVSEATLQVIRDKINGLLESIKTDSRLVQEVLGDYVEEEKILSCKETIKELGSKLLLEKIKEGDLEIKIVQQGINTLKEKMQLGFIGMFLDDNVYAMIGNSIGNVVNDLLVQKAPTLICDEIGKIEDDVLATPMSKIYQLQQEYLPNLTDEIINIYQSAIDKYLDEALSAVNIQNIVKEKVQSFDAVQLEEMIFGIMKKELKAIVYLGAILGFLIGFVNLL